MTPPSCFFIRINKKYIRISFGDIRYIESTGNYVKIFTDAGSFLTSLTMKQLEQALPDHSFCRVNRGCIVSIHRIVSFDRDGVILGNNIKIAFGDRYRRELESRIVILLSDYPRRIAVEEE